MYRVRVRVMVFNATFNNISVILVEEIGEPVENHRPTASQWIHSQWVRTNNVSGNKV